ncbi:hypothetical protein [Phenylobacterium sp.]|uniref:hypothetical protein n=1 Tax=Phenylobacterium sp. TaxID=1871053 RepID=UPI002F42E79A
MASVRLPNGDTVQDYVPGSLMGSIEEGTKQAGKFILQNGPKASRWVAYGGKGMLKAPSLVLDAAEFHNAKNKARTGSGIAGGMVGSAIGAGLGAFTAPVTGPVGAIAGAAVGNAVGEYLGKQAYDHRDEIVQGLRSAADDLTRRNAQVMTTGWGGAQVDQGVRQAVFGPRF